MEQNGTGERVKTPGRVSASSKHKGPEETKGCCISGPKRDPGGDDTHQVAARCIGGLWTTIEEPGVWAKRGKAFKRAWLVLIQRAYCRHVEKFREDAGGNCEGCSGPGGGGPMRTGQEGV